MKALLEIRGEKNKTIHPYVPSEFCSTKGYLVGVPKGYDCLISIEGCEGCYIDSVSPSPTGLSYYEAIEN